MRGCGSLLHESRAVMREQVELDSQMGSEGHQVVGLVILSSEPTIRIRGKRMLGCDKMKRNLRFFIFLGNTVTQKNSLSLVNPTDLLDQV